MRKLLFIEWGSWGQCFVEEAFREKGFILDLYQMPHTEKDAGKREHRAEDLMQTIRSADYEFVFSTNYLPVVAIVCKALTVRYVSWVYDSPNIELFSETISYSTNYVFIFDKAMCMKLWKDKIETVYYMPMAAAVEFYDRMISSPDQQEKYGGDVAFVGALYGDTLHQFQPLEQADDYLKGYIDGIVRAQKKIHGYQFLEEALSPEIVRRMQNLCRIPQRVNSNETLAWIYANYYLARMTTGIERNEIVKLLAEHFSFKLFSNNDTGTLRINNMGIVDYETELPHVFKNTKINLNITMRGIHSGMPLRIFDIMGCGGFLLTNFQSDFLDYFQPDEDFVYYQSYEDLWRKTAYYLEHDEKRQSIARNGYEKVKQGHTYQHRIDEILSFL